MPILAVFVARRLQRDVAAILLKLREIRPFLCCLRVSNANEITAKLELCYRCARRRVDWHHVRPVGIVSRQLDQLRTLTATQLFLFQHSRT